MMMVMIHTLRRQSRAGVESLLRCVSRAARSRNALDQSIRYYVYGHKRDAVQILSRGLIMRKVRGARGGRVSLAMRLRKEKALRRLSAYSRNRHSKRHRDNQCTSSFVYITSNP